MDAALASEAMTVSRYHVAGMDCAAEEQLVRLALSDVSGIEHADIYLTKRDVVIAHHISPTAIHAALAELDLDASHVDDASEITPRSDVRRERRALILASHPGRSTRGDCNELVAA